MPWVRGLFFVRRTMKIVDRAILAIAVLALLLVILFPPWMCVDPQSGGRVHAALGHHSLWSPPSPESIFRTLYPDVREVPGAVRLADFNPAVNRVQFTIEACAIVLAAGSSRYLLRRLIPIPKEDRR